MIPLLSSYHSPHTRELYTLLQKAKPLNFSMYIGVRFTILVITVLTNECPASGWVPEAGRVGGEN